MFRLERRGGIRWNDRQLILQKFNLCAKRMFLLDHKAPVTCVGRSFFPVFLRQTSVSVQLSTVSNMIKYFSSPFEFRKTRWSLRISTLAAITTWILGRGSLRRRKYLLSAIETPTRSMALYPRGQVSAVIPVTSRVAGEECNCCTRGPIIQSDPWASRLTVVFFLNG